MGFCGSYVQQVELRPLPIVNMVALKCEKGIWDACENKKIGFSRRHNRRRLLWNCSHFHKVSAKLGRILYSFLAVNNRLLSLGYDIDNF